MTFYIRLDWNVSPHQFDNTAAKIFEGECHGRPFCRMPWCLMTWSCKRLLTFSLFASVRAAWPASWWIVTGCRDSQTFLRGVHGTIFRSDSLFARVDFFKWLIASFVYIIVILEIESVFHSNEFVYVALSVTANERTKRGWRLPN